VGRPLTIDASVFVRAATPDEDGFVESRDLFLALGRTQRPVVLPTLVQPEVSGAVSRGMRDLLAVANVLAWLDRLADAHFIPLDLTLAREAADLAIQTRLRGADAVYAATARRFDAILVTLDKEQRDRMPADITVCSPAEALDK
jgi:predicted nucleic acid-binding protein